LESRRLKRKGPVPSKRKTDYERQRTREEVEQIQKDLINFAKTSWGKQWIQSNLKIGRPFRMQRGIEYVKDERRIDNMSINTGQIFATVQGTAPTPYRVKINFETISEEGWKIILDKLANKTINLVELLDGFLPEDIISIFNENGYSLFPDAEKGLNAACSCPDTAIPCKHIAAVILYIARVLDYNPFLLLELRGKSKNDIFNHLSLAQIATNDPILNKVNVKEKSANQKVEFSFNVPKMSIQELSSKQKSLVSDYKIGFKLKKPGKIIETYENLGIPPSIDNKAFRIVFKAIYRLITTHTYQLSMDADKN
jgi:uncharacterized Zn finger protein